MRPDPSRVLMGLTTNLFVNLTPDVRTPFGQATAGMAGTLTLVLAQEADRLADRLYRETQAVAAIIEDALPLLDADVAARAREALAGREAPDLRVSSLQAANDLVRGALIEVHAAVEGLDTPAARDLDARIWDELRESTRRRHIEVPR